VRREGTRATVVPGPGPLTYECKFIDQIARNSLCCEVVSIDLLHYEIGVFADQGRLMERWFWGLAHLLLFRFWLR
jgi:hypothetical protein